MFPFYKAVKLFTKGQYTTSVTLSRNEPTGTNVSEVFSSANFGCTACFGCTSSFILEVIFTISRNAKYEIQRLERNARLKTYIKRVVEEVNIHYLSKYRRINSKIKNLKHPLSKIHYYMIRLLILMH